MQVIRRLFKLKANERFYVTWLINMYVKALQANKVVAAQQITLNITLVDQGEL